MLSTRVEEPLVREGNSLLKNSEKLTVFLPTDLNWWEENSSMNTNLWKRREHKYLYESGRFGSTTPPPPLISLPRTSVPFHTHTLLYGWECFGVGVGWLCACVLFTTYPHSFYVNCGWSFLSLHLYLIYIYILSYLQQPFRSLIIFKWGFKVKMHKVVSWNA